MATSQTFLTNDNCTITYIDTSHSSPQKPFLLLIHGFTGSSQVYTKNIPSLSQHYRLIIPDLRGHGSSFKPIHGHQVARLAQDIHELVLHLTTSSSAPWSAIGGSLGCSILWAYASLFTTSPFTHQIFIDQAPLQNADLGSGWNHEFCNRGMNNPQALAGLQATLSISPETAHKGTIAACLSYRSHPLPTDNISSSQSTTDEEFFLKEAMKGDATWYGKLMADHTALDWRSSIRACYGVFSASKTKVLVLASSRSGCFPAAGPMKVVELVNEGAETESEKKAQGLVVDWGGHWMYWENPAKFDKLCLSFLTGREVKDI